MKTIIEIILIILVSSAAGDRQLKRREKGDLAPLYGYSEHQRDGRSAGYESIADSFILRLSDNATIDDFLLLIEVLENYIQNTSLSSDEDVHQWDGVTSGIALPLNAPALHWVRTLEAVEYVEQDGVMEGATSEQPSYSHHLDELDGTQDGVYSPPGDGKGVDVYVVDTGIQYDNRDFGGRAHFIGRDFVHRGGDGSDTQGHGTYVASLAAGSVHGAAKAATLFSVRVLGNQKQTSAGRVNEALNYIGNFIRDRTERKAVVLMAFTGRKSQTINEIVERLTRDGVTVVTASGNKGGDACDNSPASSESAITVGATDSNKKLWYFRWAPNQFFVYRVGSAIGSCMDVFATGKDLWGGGIDGDRTETGTSGSAALVAGVVAIMLQRNSTLAPHQIKELIIDTSLKDLVDMSAAESELQDGTPNRLLTIPDVSPPQSMEAAARWPKQFTQVHDSRRLVYFTDLSPYDVESLFTAMKAQEYTMESLSYTNPGSTDENTSFIAVFALNTNAMEGYTVHFHLDTSEVEAVLSSASETDISKIKIFMGYQKEGRHVYLIVQTSEVRNFVAAMGQLQQDAVTFKALILAAGYTQKQQAVDETTKHVTTYYCPGSLLKGVLYAFSNIHSTSLKTIVQHWQKPLVHISTYQRRKGETRFITVFDTTKQKGQEQMLLSGTNLDSQLDDYAAQGYLPTLITPWFLRQESNYFSLVLKQN